MMENASNLEFENFKSQYTYILKKSDEALIIESKGNKLEAYSLFRSIVCEIDNILAVYINSTNVKIIQNVKNLQVLRDNVCDCICRVQSETISNDEIKAAQILFSIQSECQYTKINSNGEFGIPSYPGSLEIYEYLSSNEERRGFITVSDWICPLVENVTPVLITPEGVLIFFDAEAGENSKIAVTFPYDVTRENFQRCISVLSTLTVLVIDGEDISNTGDKLIKTNGEIIAEELSRDFQYVSSGVVSGAKKLGELVVKGSNELCHRISAGEGSIHPNIQTGLKYARSGSHEVVKVSGKAIGVLAQATKYVASKAAPHIISTANSFIPDKWKEKGKNGEISTVDQVVLVTGSCLHGFLLLFDSLHDGAIIFGRSAARSCGKVVRHRYGNDVGQSTENALYAAGNLGMIAMVAHQFTKKGLLKTTAKVTAVEVTDKYRKQSHDQRSVKPLCQTDSGSDSNKHI